MLKISGSTESVTWLGKSGVGVGSDSRAGRDGIKLDRSEVDSNEIRDNEVGKNVQKLSKSKNLSKSEKTVRSDFLTPGAKLTFAKLWQAFIKTPILHHFYLECYIRIETDVSGYIIGEVYGQLILDDLNQLHSVTFFSQKMVSAKIRYKTHNGELIVIVEAFKTWKDYLDDS